ncbi:spermatogenesis-associated protein 33 [Myotis myotis]|uniref:spermatogenesis-associated protein 33 n=1 Tax=Myotis myotis TaxID=51298 RepID=UPI00174CA841|nr:spermatogenesis-associated protein 33 [Myotis myotis]
MHCPRVSQSRPINCPYIPGEEQMGCTHSGPKPKQRSVDSLSSKSAEGRFRKEGAATQQVPARGVKGTTHPKGDRAQVAASGRTSVHSSVSNLTCFFVLNHESSPCALAAHRRRLLRCRLTEYLDVSFLPEKRGAKATSGRSKVVIPQIVITSASDETLTCSIGSQEQRTIHEEMEWGPYARHRNPSTIDAYALQTKE